jgi:hypothetical protein
LEALTAGRKFEIQTVGLYKESTARLKSCPPEERN